MHSAFPSKAEFLIFFWRLKMPENKNKQPPLKFFLMPLAKFSVSTICTVWDCLSFAVKRMKQVCSQKVFKSVSVFTLLSLFLQLLNQVLNRVTAERNLFDRVVNLRLPGKLPFLAFCSRLPKKNHISVIKYIFWISQD